MHPRSRFGLVELNFSVKPTLTGELVVLRPLDEGDYDALKAAGHKPEAHVFGSGGHGFGMKKQGTTSDHWVEEFYYWLEAQGFAKAA